MGGLLFAEALTTWPLQGPARFVRNRKLKCCQGRTCYYSIADLLFVKSNFDNFYKFCNALMSKMLPDMGFRVFDVRINGPCINDNWNLFWEYNSLCPLRNDVIYVRRVRRVRHIIQWVVSLMLIRDSRLQISWSVSFLNMLYYTSIQWKVKLFQAFSKIFSSSASSSASSSVCSMKYSVILSTLQQVIYS